MNTTEFIAKLAADNGISKVSAKAMVDVVFGEVTTVLMTGEDNLRTPFGTFKIKDIPAKEYPIRFGEHAGETKLCDPCKRIKFTLASGIKEALK